MKKFIVILTSALLLSFGFAYSPTSTDQAIIENFTTKAFKLIDQKGSDFQELLVTKLKNLSRKFQYDERGNYLMTQITQKVEDYGNGEDLGAMLDGILGTTSTNQTKTETAQTGSNSKLAEKFENLTDSLPDAQALKENMAKYGCTNVFRPESILSGMDSLYSKRYSCGDDTRNSLKKNSPNGIVNPISANYNTVTCENMYTKLIIDTCELYKENYSCVYGKELDYDCTLFNKFKTPMQVTSSGVSYSSPVMKDLKKLDVKSYSYYTDRELLLSDGINKYAVKFSFGCNISPFSSVYYDGGYISSTTKFYLTDAGTTCSVEELAKLN